MAQTNMTNRIDEYYTGENLVRLKRSMEQSKRGEVITFTMAELEAMETGEIPQRAIEFLEKHKAAYANN